MEEKGFVWHHYIGKKVSVDGNIGEIVQQHITRKYMSGKAYEHETYTVYFNTGKKELVYLHRIKEPVSIEIGQEVHMNRFLIDVCLKFKKFDVIEGLQAETETLIRNEKKDKV